MTEDRRIAVITGDMNSGKRTIIAHRIEELRQAGVTVVEFEPNEIKGQSIDFVMWDECHLIEPRSLPGYSERLAAFADIETSPRVIAVDYSVIDLAVKSDKPLPGHRHLLPPQNRSPRKGRKK